MITIDVKTTLICLVLVALLVLIIYLCVMVKNLIVTLKKANQVIDDASVVSGIASDKATEIDGMVGDIGDAVTGVVKAVKGNENLIGTLTNLAKGIGALVSVLKKDEKSDSESKGRSHKSRKNVK